MSKIFDHIWGYGTLAMFVIFAIFESLAFYLRKPEEYTYSAWVWRHIGTRAGWTRTTTPLRIAMLIFLLWLAEHFTFGWF